MKMQIILFALSILFIISCKSGASFDNNLLDIEMKQKKVVAITALDLTSAEHYAALSAYFREVTELALSLKSDVKAQEYWASQVKANKLSGFCAKYVLTLPFWENLNRQCSVDGHYLCPDELKEYPAVLGTVLKNSPQSLKNDFAADAECSKWKLIK